MLVETINITSILVAAISVLSGAGFWAFMQNRSKLKFQQQEERNRQDNEFKELLKVQVQTLTEKVDSLLNDKVELLKEMSELKANLIKAEQTIKHLEETLRYRGKRANDYDD